jgi:Na+-driven multidrug efflux pump
MFIQTPMVLINTFLNWVFIYGKFGFEPMGAYGAALATFIAYFIATGVNILMVMKLDLPFKGTLKEIFDFDYEFVKPIVIKTIPIIISEFLFGTARLLYTKAFATLGTSVFVGERLAENLTMFVNGFVFASANTVGAVIGTALGAMKTDADKEEVKNKSKFLLICLAVVSTSVFVTCWFILPHAVKLYGVESPEIYNNAVTLIKLNGLFAGLRTISSSMLFILRAGGDMIYATIVDSGLAWLIGLPLTYLALIFLDVNLLQLKLITLIETVVKVGVALYRYSTWKWVKKVI